MSEIKIESNISETIAKLISIRACLNDNLTLAKELQERVGGMNWSGNHRDHFDAVLEILIKYHAGLNSVGENLINVMKLLSEDVEGYDTLPSVQRLMEIE